MTEIIQVVTTTSSREDAARIGRELVERRLAACVQIEGPIGSIYHWRGVVESAEEWRLTIKSLARLFSKLETAIRELHPYETPEVMATEATGVSRAYGQWLEAEIAGS
jgi:periplasmic divalent cation tolerance protein